MKTRNLKQLGISVGLACYLCASISQAAPVQWSASSGGNDHWYDFVTLTSATSTAETFAESQTFMGANGYLATITSAAEQSFLNSIWPGPSGTEFGNNFYIGLSDRDTEGVYKWIGGPEDGQVATYTNWASGEPNDFGSGEDSVVAFWQDSAGGAWNDVPSDFGSRLIVEYSGTVSAVPLPAGLPLLLGGLGILGLSRRKS